ncbi:hypothetical protein PybrP1_004715 [[Pythium] brassicae (nom. inval.)]|nr:hypothetical protein PybrP1_004715 [[Pythium] brassicae (nom. inval.)]
MHPTFRRFREPGADLGADHEDACDLARSLQPPPSARALSAAALRELEARVGPQYVPSAAQLQLFQHQQQQQQRRGGDTFFPRASDVDWPPAHGAEMVAPHAFFPGGELSEFDTGPQASLNAQFLPPSMSRYRRSERDRMFRMRVMYLQQHHMLEHQKAEERQRMQPPQPPLRRPVPHHHSQHPHQPGLPLPLPQQLSVPVLNSHHEPEYEPPRRLQRELPPPSAPLSASTATATATATLSSASPQSPPVAASGLSLPLPPPLSSTARRFTTGGGGSAAVPEPGLSADPPAVLEPYSSGKLGPARRGAAPHQQRTAASAVGGSTTSFRSVGAESQPLSKQQRAKLSNHGVATAEPSRPVADEPPSDERASDSESDSVPANASARRNGGNKRRATSTTTPATPALSEPVEPGEPKRRCGRKSMNYSSEEKRERNRAAVKKCRQRQALKYDYLLQKAEVLETENTALSDLLVNNVDLEEARRASLTRGIQMDILFKIKEIFTQSLPKDFVLDADSIWDLNSVLAVSMPSRCYYGIESIKEFWRTSLRMRNKGKIRSFWAWLFRLPPGDRFADFDIVPFSDSSNLYFVTWTTKSEPPLSGSMVIMFGQGHRVTLHVECFGWLIWRYLLTNEPFPEPNE